MIRMTIASILLACGVDAWLPQHRGDLAAFNQSRRMEELGKRFEPQLHDGVTKIRGVNFGGEPQTFRLIAPAPRTSVKWLTKNTNSRLVDLRALADGEGVEINGL